MAERIISGASVFYRCRAVPKYLVSADSRLFALLEDGTWEEIKSN